MGTGKGTGSGRVDDEDWAVPSPFGGGDGGAEAVAASYCTLKVPLQDQGYRM